MENKALRLLLAGGGTGGHLFPVLAVVQAARALPLIEVEVSHMGSASGIEQHILNQAGIPSTTLEVSGLRGRNPAQIAWRALKMAAAVRSALKRIDVFRPNAVFTSGGYVSVPAVVAARLRRVPVLLFSADVSAGLAIRLAARLAERIALPVSQASGGLPPGKIFVSGYPVRPDLLQPLGKRAAKQRLGFDPDQPLLLCFGGSQGAHRLNVAIENGLNQLLAATQVLHLTGSADAPALQSHAGPRYQVHAFLDEMPVALAAADLAVCRAGASTLGELPAVGLPAVLVPGPFAGAHQRFNAAVLAEAGGAVVVTNDEVDAKLVPVVLALLGDSQRLDSMSRSMRSLARPDAARVIARELLELAA